MLLWARLKSLFLHLICLKEDEISTIDPRAFPRGLYIHLPFCPAICNYCDFAVER